MKFIFRNILFASVLLIVLTSEARSQFYNGLQMDFGKSRVQYNDFYWQFLRFNRLDAYFYVDGRELAMNVGKIASKKVVEMEQFFDYNLDGRLVFIVYNKITDFRQSNIGLVSGDEQYNIGGMTKIIGNKVFIYNEGDFNKLEKQITAAIAEVLLNEMIYGKNFRQKLTNSTLLTLPDWYLQGLISYLSEGWNFETENRVKAGVLSNRYEKFNRLTGEDAIYAGHSLWNFIANTYGKAVIPNIIYLTRVSKNIDSGFLYVLGTPLKSLSVEWISYYEKLYKESDQQYEAPSGQALVKKPKTTRRYSNVKISPDGKYAAWVTNELGQYKIWMKDLETDKTKRILKKEHKLDQITDFSFPTLCWHPTGQLLTYFTEEQGTLYINFYFPEDKRRERKEVFDVEKVLQASYSDNGMKIVLSAIKKGQTDIYVYNVAANAVQRVTNDFADDFNPRFINQSKSIIFNSNRTKTSLEKSGDSQDISKTHDVFIYDYENKSDILINLTQTPYTTEFMPFELSERKYCILSDENGIVNQYLALYDSSLAYIDTAAHYTYFSKTYPLSNFNRGIIEHDVNKAEGIQSNLFYTDKRMSLYKREFKAEDYPFGEKLNMTQLRKKLTQQLIIEDSLKNMKPVVKTADDIELPESDVNDSLPPVPSDTAYVDTRNYVFEKEKAPEKYVIPEKKQKETLTPESGEPRQRIYLTTFYTDYVVNQVDFGFLNTSYQAFTGAAGYYNPGFNLLFKLGTQELFEDYKITGAFRLAGDFDSNEYLLSFENLKKRVDKQFVFHRQSFKNIFNNYIVLKTHSHELMYITKYPFSQVLSLKATLNIRNDRLVLQSRNTETLKEPNVFNTWGGAKVELIFDNTRNRGINIYHGTRWKVYAEAYKQIDEKKSDFFVFGADFRHYQKIHRNLIWASRIATSTSLGNRKLVYYLGGVDNWINLSKTPTFTPFTEVPINWEQNYAYQAIATNMRGFAQNARNGNSFAVINNEIRWPAVKYIANRPINSDFLANLQFIGFFDVGSAWSGKSPLDEKNAYNTQIYENGPITVIIDSDRSPVVYGYGFGVRSKLLGYFVRADWAWGVERGIVQPRIFYLSLSLDF